MERHLPDYEIRLWTIDEALAADIPFVSSALHRRQWGLATEAMRFYAVWKEGGVYMDSDVFLYRRFNEVIPDSGLATFCAPFDHAGKTHFHLQAAFFIGEAGNAVCAEALDYYRNLPPNFEKNGKLLSSSALLAQIAARRGFVGEDREQHLGTELSIYPTYLFKPRRRFPMHPETIGEHRIYGSWRKRSLKHAAARKVGHLFQVIRYTVLKR